MGDRPVGRCLLWKAYEGRGIGRALLTAVLKNLPGAEFPVYLHTSLELSRHQTLRGLWLQLLSDPVIGQRRNDLEACLPILETYMPRSAYEALIIARAPQLFLNAAASSATAEF